MSLSVTCGNNHVKRRWDTFDAPDSQKQFACSTANNTQSPKDNECASPKFNGKYRLLFHRKSFRFTESPIDWKVILASLPLNKVVIKHGENEWGVEQQEPSQTSWRLCDINVWKFPFEWRLQVPTNNQSKPTVTLSNQSMRPVKNTNDKGWHLIGPGQLTRFEKTGGDKEERGNDTGQRGVADETLYISKKGDAANECESGTRTQERSVW
jgi:hypothetical protein